MDNAVCVPAPAILWNEAAFIGEDGFYKSWLVIRRETLMKTELGKQKCSWMIRGASGATGCL